MNFEIPKGDQNYVRFRVVNEEKHIFTDKELDEIVFTCRKSPYKESKIIMQKRMTKGEILFNSQLNKFLILIKKEDTKDLDYGTYSYDIEITKNPIIKTKTGTIKVTSEYTIGG